MKILTDKLQWKILFPLCLLFCISFSSFSQCSLSPGDVLFTGYNLLDDNDNGNTRDDSFSFILLKEVSVGSELYFTDLGWTGAEFQTAANAPSDAILKWTSDAIYPAGTEIIVYCKYKMLAKDRLGNTKGTITVAQNSYNTTQNLVPVPQYMSLAEFSGDQIFAFTGTINNPIFIAGISINKTPGTPWEATLLPTTYGADLSTRPTVLATASQNLGISYVDPTDPFSNAAYAARYNREVAGPFGLPSELLAKINLAANWEIKSDGNVFNPILPSTEIFVTPFTIASQPVNKTNICPGTSTSFSVTAPGACSYQWEVTDNNGTFVPIITGGGIYTNFNTATLNISNVSGLNQKKYRVRVRGSSEALSEFATLSLVSPIVLNTDPLPAAGIGLPYSEQIRVTSGGTGVYSYAITSGSLPNGLTLNTANGIISGSSSNAGLYNITVTVSDNCTSPNTAIQAYSIVVGVLNQTITLTDYQKTYGDVFDLPLNSSAGLPITYASGTPSVATVTGNQVTVVGVGTSIITATQGGNANYHPATPVNSTLTISKKNVTVALNSLPAVTKEYDRTNTATLAASNYILTGVLPADAITVSSSATYNTANAGAGKVVTATDFQLSGAQKDNYNVSTLNAVMSGVISTKPITVSLNTSPVISKTYDNTLTATLQDANYNLSGLIAPDVVSVSGNASYTSVDAGTGKTLNVSNLTLAGADKNNYSLAATTVSTTSAEISPKPLVIALQSTPAISKVYNNSNEAILASGNYILNGKLGTDVVTVSGTATYNDKDAAVGKTITVGNLILAGAQKGNYSISNATASTTGAITPLPIQLILNPLPVIQKVYDGNDIATLLPEHYVLIGKLGTDEVTATGTATYNDKNAGTNKTITAGTLVLDGAQKGNYNLSTITAAMTGNTITPADLTLALNASPLITKAYDNTTLALLTAANYSLNGKITGDLVTVSGTANYESNQVGTGIDITVNSFVLVGTDKGNYNLTTSTATTTGNITKKVLTLALNSVPLISKAYDNNTSAILAAGNYNLIGILGSDDLSVSGTANYDTKGVGTGKTITANNFVLAGAQKDNYSLSTITSTTFGNISTAPLTLALNSTPLISKTYDNSTSATLVPANYTLSGIVGSESVTVSGTAAYNTKDAGTGKIVTANSFVLAGADQANYHLTTSSATTSAEITAKSITLALNANPLINKIYNGNTTAILTPANYTLTGVLGTDVVVVTGTGNYDNKNKGTGKTITANNFSLLGAQKDNYSLITSTATTTGNITASPITLTLNALPAISKVYDNNVSATLVPENYTLNGIIGSDLVTVTGTSTYDTKDAGTGKTITTSNFVLDGTDKGNYSLLTSTASTTGSVNSAPLTLTLNANPLITKTYDNNTVATLAPANYSLTGVLGTDAVTVSGLANFDTNTAENGKTITAQTFVLAGAQKDNYSLSTTSATTTGNITKKALSLALNELPVISKEYDNNTSASLAPGNYSLSGILGSDELSVTGTANYNTKAVGTGKTISVNNFLLAGAQKDNYSLSTNLATTKGNIGQKTITARLNATPLISKVYDNTTTANLAPENYSLSGILGSDIVSVTGTASYDHKNAGTEKVVNAQNLVLAGADQSNYLLSNTTAATTGNITKFPLSLALNAAPLISKEYDNTSTATLSPANFSLIGVKGSDQLSVSGTASYANEDAGNGKTINAGSFILTGADLGNYSLITNTASTTGNITKKLLTVTAIDQTKYQGTVNPVLTLDYSGFVNGEGVNDLATLPTASTLAQTGSEIGDYDITPAGGLATNYNFNYVKGNLKVLPGAPTSVLLAAIPLYENLASGTKAGSLSATSNNPNATFTYSLVSGNGDTDNAAFSIAGDQLKSNQVFDFESKSSFSIRLRATTQFGLSLDQQFNILISDVNEAPTLAAIANQTLCATSTVQNIPLTGISAGPENAQKTTLSFTNSNPNLVQNLSVNQTGATGSFSYRIKNGASGTATITLTVKDNGGTENGGVDTYTRTFVVTVNPLPVITIQANLGNVFGNSTEVSKGETVALTATGGSSYTWSPTSSILNTPNAATIMVRPTETTTYTVTVSNANGCTESSTFTVKVMDDLAKIKATNILSPNGDGYNDKWIIDNIDVYPNNEVKIFDKAGRQIYSKRGYDNSWDGTLNGTALSEGTYYYVIDFGNNRPKFKGFITIIKEN